MMGLLSQCRVALMGESQCHHVIPVSGTSPGVSLMGQLLRKATKGTRSLRDAVRAELPDLFPNDGSVSRSVGSKTVG